MTIRPTTRIGRALHRARRLDIRAARIFATAVLAAVLVAAAPRAALAVSMRDLVELSKAGLSDDVLIALIEADGTVFNLDGPKILDLRASGLSERVIMAMIRTARPPVPAEPAAQAAPVPAEPVGAPYFVVIGQDPPPPPPAPTPTYVIPWVPWTSWPRPVGPSQPFMDRRGFGRFINDGWVEPSRRR